VTGFLAAAGAAAAWCLFVYMSPFGRCFRCGGRGAVIHGRKPRPCPRCKGAKRQQRLGSRTVHRAVRMVRAELARTRREEH
jgi:DnaJ-class molecular chaperone